MQGSPTVGLSEMHPPTKFSNQLTSVWTEYRKVTVFYFLIWNFAFLNSIFYVILTSHYWYLGGWTHTIYSCIKPNLYHTCEQVVSSALRVTPHRDRYRGRRATTATVTSWRRPRQHQFVTKEDGVAPPAIIRVYSPASGPSASRRKGKRIIYYATLPEISGSHTFL